MQIKSQTSVSPLHQDIYFDEQFELYFVSDIHGEYALLMKALIELGFRFPLGGVIRDILVIGGDLIDRGDQSLEMLGAARFNPAFISIAGNHEIMASAACRGNKEQAILWQYNGGEWSDKVDKYHLKDMVDFAANRPLALTIHTSMHKIGVCHAEVPSPYNWQELISSLESKTLSSDEQKALLAGRKDFKQRKNHYVEGVDAVVLGHNMIEGMQPLVLGNRYYIDAGMSYGDRTLLLKYHIGGEHMGLFQSFGFSKEPITGTLNLLE
ncbi:metallophosphoesterase [Agarivorans sp. DSG3-1]|uniref:metallophosphoesterase n=1 Tax=Agarivorans sp. DSG3-1 TaxID=3342249 RepID=UPI00398EA039